MADKEKTRKTVATNNDLQPENDAGNQRSDGTEDAGASRPSENMISDNAGQTVDKPDNSKAGAGESGDPAPERSKPEIEESSVVEASERIDAPFVAIPAVENGDSEAQTGEQPDANATAKQESPVATQEIDVFDERASGDGDGDGDGDASDPTRGSDRQSAGDIAPESGDGDASDPSKTGDAEGTGPVRQAPQADTASESGDGDASDPTRRGDSDATEPENDIQELTGSGDPDAGNPVKPAPDSKDLAGEEKLLTGGPTTANEVDAVADISRVDLDTEKLENLEDAALSSIVDESAVDEEALGEILGEPEVRPDTTSVVSHAFHPLEISTNASGVTTVVDRDIGSTTEKVYDANGNLLSTQIDTATSTVIIDYVENTTTTIEGGAATTEYGDGSAKVVHADGVEELIGSDGTVILETHPNGLIIEQLPGGGVEITDPDGTRTVIHADGSSTTYHPDGTTTNTPATQNGDEDQGEDDDSDSSDDSSDGDDDSASSENSDTEQGADASDDDSDSEESSKDESGTPNPVADDESAPILSFLTDGRLGRQEQEDVERGIDAEVGGGHTDPVDHEEAEATLEFLTSDLGRKQAAENEQAIEDAHGGGHTDPSDHEFDPSGIPTREDLWNVEYITSGGGVTDPVDDVADSSGDSIQDSVATGHEQFASIAETASSLVDALEVNIHLSADELEDDFE